MTMADRHSPSAEAKRLRALNMRTAVILFAIAFVFFGGIIVANYAGGAATGVTVLGIAVVLYLVVAIGRNVGARK